MLDEASELVNFIESLLPTGFLFSTITTHETLFAASCFAICDKVVSGVAISVVVDMYSDTFMIDDVVE